MERGYIKANLPLLVTLVTLNRNAVFAPVSGTCPQVLGKKLQLFLWVSTRGAIKISPQIAYDWHFLPVTCPSTLQ